MERHPSLAKGYNTTADGRISAKSLWTEISTQLNSHGPPLRNAEGWKKVWADYKFNIKKKLKLNKLSISGTGGGPSRLQVFSPTEEAVIQLIDLNTSVNGFVSTPSLGDNILELPNLSEDQTPILSEIMLDDNNNDSNSNNDLEPQATSRKTTSTKVTRDHLIQKQINLQQTFHENLTKKIDSLVNIVNDCSKSLKRQVRLKEKTYDLKKRALELKERKINLKEKDRLENRRLKVEKLEIKRQKLELQKIL